MLGLSESFKRGTRKLCISRSHPVFEPKNLRVPGQQYLLKHAWIRPLPLMHISNCYDTVPILPL